MKLAVGRSRFRGSAAAAGFVAGVAVTLMLCAGHQKHRWACAGGVPWHDSGLLLAYVLREAAVWPTAKRCRCRACSEAHLEASSRSLPGQLPENSSSSDVAAQAQGDRGMWVQAAARRPPPPPPFVPPDLDSATQLMVSFGNSAYFELMQNWARSVSMLPDTPFLIAGKCGREQRGAQQPVLAAYVWYICAPDAAAPEPAAAPRPAPHGHHQRA